MLTKHPLLGAAMWQNALFLEGPFTHFSHPRKLGNQGERMIALWNQGPSGPCVPLPGSPTRGRGGLRCSWRRCDQGKSFPSTQGRDFSGPGLLRVGGLSTLCQCFNVLRVSCHLQITTCHSWKEQFPDSVSPDSGALSGQSGQDHFPGGQVGS